MNPQIDQDTIDNLPQTRQFGPKGIAIENIIELRQRGLSVGQIGKLLGCHNSNISRRLQTVSEDIDLTDKYVNNRAKIFAYHQRKIIQSITPTDISKAGLLEKVKSASFLYNAERLETGQSTQNIAYADMLQARDKARKRREELEAEASS